MTDKEYLQNDLAQAIASVTLALEYPKLLQVEEYADLTATLDLIRNVYKRLSK